MSISLNSIITYEKIFTGWPLVHRGVTSVGVGVGVGTVHSRGGGHEVATYIAANVSVTALGATRDGVKVSRVVKTVMVAEVGSSGHNTHTWG